MAAAAAVAVALGLSLGDQLLVAHATSVTQGPAVVLSPLPGTPDALPTTQVSFLGAPASRLRDIVVRGSESGLHSGRLQFYSTHTGGSFLPAHPFSPGEHVTVAATLVGYGAPRRLDTNFEVASPYTLPEPKPRPLTGTPSTVQSFHSRHDIAPPVVTVTTPAATPALGDIFVSPDAGPGQAGPMIIDPSGRLVWFKPLPQGTTAFDLNVQRYRGAPALTWWQGNVVQGHGQGADVIDTTRYTQIAVVHAGNGLYADLHDFRITPQGTAWLTAFEPQHMDLRAIGGRSDGLLDDGVVQEIDIRTGLVMFSWHALGHVPLADTYMRAPQQAGNVLDFFHVNSIDPLPGGQLLISARNTWAAYLIDESSGDVLWQLGGKHSSFTLGPGLSFAWQHDVELLPSGTLSLFNNDAAPAEGSQSSGLEIDIDMADHTASLARRITYPGGAITADSQGDVQPLANGDVLIDWGQAGRVSELSPAGQLTFDMQFAAPANSYRAFRYPWSARPTTRPALSVSAQSDGSAELYASWNGATGVASWRVLGGRSASTLQALGTYPATGFETAMSVASTATAYEVQALSASGATLSTSTVAST